MMGKVSSERQRRFEAVYREHRLEVLAYCTRHLTQADAADTRAEAFLVAWRRFDQLPLPPQTLPYLYGIAARVISNQRRTLWRRSRLDARLGSLGIARTARGP
jgi:DNA-directed RNA polymerase specialized sigma24 family protein